MGLVKTSITAAAAFAAGIMAFTAGATAGPMNGAAARVFADTPGVTEQVQYTYRRHRMSAYERERISRNYFARMRARVDGDGTILIPGITTTRSGITIISGAPRPLYGNPQRIGVWDRSGGGRIGVWSGRPSGRLTGGVPRVGGRH
jgi:hypothetical protein